MGLIQSIKRKIFLHEAEPVVKEIVDKLAEASEKQGDIMDSTAKEWLVKVVALPAVAAGFNAGVIALKDGFQAADIWQVLTVFGTAALFAIMHSPRPEAPSHL